MAEQADEWDDEMFPDNEEGDTCWVCDQAIPFGEGTDCYECSEPIHRSCARLNFMCEDVCLLCYGEPEE